MIRAIRRPIDEPCLGDVDLAVTGRDAPSTGARLEQPGEADVGPASADGFGDLRQSRTIRWKVEQR